MSKKILISVARSVLHYIVHCYIWYETSHCRYNKYMAEEVKRSTEGENMCWQSLRGLKLGQVSSLLLCV